VLAVFFLSAAAAFVLSDHVAAFLTGPVSDLGVRLYTFSPAEKFMAHLRISALAGAVLTAPFCVTQAGLFIWPGLEGRERMAARFVLFGVPSLFLAGSVAAYKFFAPAVLRFFLSFGSGDGVEAMWGFGEYLSLLAGLMFGAGAALQMPLILLALFALGVANPRKVASARPYVAVLIFFAAAILTPPDVTSQVMLGVPLYLLFEMTVAVGMVMGRGRATDKKNGN
jgi:sec-independent protein translocase protein TatC